MALNTSAAMVLFYDIEGDAADHDDWHSYEHLHERLSVPGFRRGSRWITDGEGPRYLVIYEVDNTGIGTSQPYLDRLNNPTRWTREIMPRFRGMVRGFCDVAASSGYGLGSRITAIRFEPPESSIDEVSTWLGEDALPSIMMRRGIASAHLLRPVPPPPMTEEQALRGPDRPMPWLVLISGYDGSALEAATAKLVSPKELADRGVTREIAVGRYALDYVAGYEEVGRTPLPPPVARGGRTGPSR